MQKIILLLSCLFLTSVPSFGQDRTQHASDSLFATREALAVKEQFSLSEAQCKALEQAGIRSTEVMRTVFQQYRGTAAFEEQLAKAKKLKDSLYQSILGEKNYRLYCEKRFRERERKVMEQRQRVSQIEDSLHIKSSVNEK